jgi:hypothetical protein
MTQSASTFTQQLNGNFIGMLHWAQLDELWCRVRAEPEGWYASQSGQLVPTAPMTADALNCFVDEVDALLRREHKQDFCGIVYADHREYPGFIKIYDPHNMGSFCSCSSTPIAPLWVLSRSQPEHIQDDSVVHEPRGGWWQRLFGQPQR